MFVKHLTNRQKTAAMLRKGERWQTIMLKKLTLRLLRSQLLLQHLVVASPEFHQLEGSMQQTDLRSRPPYLC